MAKEDLIYDRELFIEIIESNDKIKFLRSDEHNTFHARFYEGISGNLVMIDSSDLEETVSYSEGSSILEQLGLAELIDRLFQATQMPEETQEIAILEDNILKEEALKGL